MFCGIQLPEKGYYELMFTAYFSKQYLGKPSQNKKSKTWDICQTSAFKIIGKPLLGEKYVEGKKKKE